MREILWTIEHAIWRGLVWLLFIATLILVLEAHVDGII
jgi:hypothetical protein